MSPEEQRLSDDFASNCGRLPAPVSERYRIVTPFGEYQHPQQRNVRMKSNGIEMQTTSGAEALAVFNGVVTVIYVYQGQYFVCITTVSVVQQRCVRYKQCIIGPYRRFFSSFR